MNTTHRNNYTKLVSSINTLLPTQDHVTITGFFTSRSEFDAHIINLISRLDDEQSKGLFWSRLINTQRENKKVA